MTMNFTNALTLILLALGTGVMFLSIWETRAVLHLLKSNRYARGWRTLLILMILFLWGYVAALTMVFLNLQGVLATLTGIIFFFGAFFVYLTVQIGRRTIDDVFKTTVSKNYLDNVIKSMSNAFILLTPEAKIQMVNQATTELLGYPAQELIGKPFETVLLSPNGRPSKELIVAEKAIKNVDTTFRSLQGDAIPVLVSGSAICDPDGTEQGLVYIAQDLTQHKRNEKTLRQSEARFRKIFEHSHDAILVIDPARDAFLDANTKAYEMLNLTYDELLATPISTIYANQTAQFQAFTETIFKDGHGWSDELTCLTKDGYQVEVEISGSVIQYSDEQPLMIAFVRNVSERKQNEAQQLRFTNQLRTAADISREINTILNPERVLEKTVTLLKTRLDLYHVHIYLLNEETHELVLQTGSGEIGRQLLQRHHKIALDYQQSLVARAAREGEIILVNDISLARDHMSNPLLPKTKSEVAVPIKAGNQILGVFDVQDDHKDRFDQADLDVFSTLSDQIAIALENARLFEQQKQAEYKLRESEERFRALTETATDGIIIIDSDSQIVFANQAVGKILGYSVEELLGQSSDVIIPEALRNPEQASLASYLDTGLRHISKNKIELPGIDKNGQEIFLEVSLGDFVSQGKRFFSGIFRDVTERKLAEEQLHYQANLMRNISDAIVSTDLDYCIKTWNQAAEKIYGWKEDEVVGLSVADVTKTDYLHQNREEVLACFSENGFWQGEVRQQRKDGTQLMISSAMSLIKSNAGQPIGIVAVNHDITKRVKSEKEVRQLNNKLEAANRELEAFSYSVSHDLRTPLRAIKGFSRILVTKYGANLPPETKRYFEMIDNHTNQMNDLIDGLLNFSRLGRHPIKKQPVSLNNLVQGIITELTFHQKDRQIEIKIDKLPNCQADPILIKQVFMNLLTNAFKFTRHQPTAEIEVGFQSKNGETVYFVKDNGVGFDMRYADKLFGVFQRLHLTDEFEGTGVGLATVHRIISRHGGRVWAEAAVDKGATFYFTL